MKHIKTFALHAACALWLSMLSGCATLEGQPVNFLTTQDEIALGARLSAEIEKQEKVLADPPIQAYIEEIGQRIVRNVARHDVPYAFTVIDNPTQVNAFALPGGHMYIYTGLLKLCEDEAELAGVMSHEIAHVASHHHDEAISRQYTYELLAGIALGQNPRAGAQIAAQLLGTAGAMRFSRENEREADRLGMELLFRAGYQPEAMVRFMEKMMAEDARQGGAQQLPFFASHPATTERITALRAIVLTYPMELQLQGQRNEQRYREIVRNRLK